MDPNPKIAPAQTPEPEGLPDTIWPDIVNPENPGGDRLPNSE
jgi:hypothetical protein